MNRSRLTLAGCTVALLLGAFAVPNGGALAQETRPAAAREKKAKTQTVKVYTCAEHAQVRMPARGKCPMCKADLTATKLDVSDGDPYTLDVCVVSGEKLGSMGDPIVLVYEGREVRLCFDAMIVEQQRSSYPTDICVVSGEKLGSMGDPIELVYRNRLVRLCCKGCVRGMQKSPGKYLAKLDEAVIAQQLDTYPYDVCVISQSRLDTMGKPMEFVVANRLVLFCCDGCLQTFWKDPATSLAKLGPVANR